MHGYYGNKQTVINFGSYNLPSFFVEDKNWIVMELCYVMFCDCNTNKISVDLNLIGINKSKINVLSAILWQLY